MVYCESCHTERLDGPENCPRCGRRLSHAAPRPTAGGVLDADAPAAPPPRDATEHHHQEAPGVRVVGGRPRRGRRYLITYLGREQSVTDWARDLGLSPGLVYRRLRDGQGVPELLAPADAAKKPGERRGLVVPTFLMVDQGARSPGVSVVGRDNCSAWKNEAFDQFLRNSQVGDVLSVGDDVYLVRLGDLRKSNLSREARRGTPGDVTNQAVVDANNLEHAARDYLAEQFYMLRAVVGPAETNFNPEHAAKILKKGERE